MDIARTIKNKFKLQESLSFLAKYVTKHFPKKANSIYTEFEKNLLFRLYCCHAERKKIVNYFNKRYDKSLTVEALATMMNKYGIKNRKRYGERQVTYKQKMDIIKKYKDGVSTADIAKEYNYQTRNSIYQILDEYKIDRRTQDDINYMNCQYRDLSFKKIDSEVKGYFLGLLLTDGYLVRKQIGLSLTNKDCIEFIHNTLNLPMTTINRPNRQTMYRVVLHGKERIEDLKKWGILPRKSLILDGPKIESIDKKNTPICYSWNNRRRWMGKKRWQRILHMFSISKIY